MGYHVLYFEERERAVRVRDHKVDLVCVCVCARAYLCVCLCVLVRGCVYTLHGCACARTCTAWVRTHACACWK